MLEVKQMLRQTVLQQRKLLSNTDRHTQSEQIAANLISHPIFADAKTVASYISWTTEPDTSEINLALASRGSKLLVPAGGLSPGWKTLEGNLQPPEVLVNAELIIVPALAVDYAGTRMGRGAGWYDQALVHRHPDANVIALLFEGEYLPEQLLPRESHDVPIKLVITPHQVHKADLP